jgi:hypothetical protein
MVEKKNYKDNEEGEEEKEQNVYKKKNGYKKMKHEVKRGH